MGREPVVRQLCWPSEPIVAAMCFDPTVSWLLIATQPATLYILPALALLVSNAQLKWSLYQIMLLLTEMKVTINVYVSLNGLGHQVV